MMFAVKSSAATERSLGAHARSLRSRALGIADAIVATFNAPGTHRYVCIAHEVQHMVEKAIVEP
jgi:plastocyanin